MKKRIISIALLCVMLLGIMLGATSCGEQSKINKAVLATKALDNLSLDLFMDLNVTAGYVARDYKVSKEITSVLLESGERLTREESKNYGDEDKSEITYVDGEYVYLPNGMKQKRDEYEKYNTVYTNLVEMLLVEMPKRLFEEDNNGYKLAKSEEYSGKLKISASFNNATVSEMETFKNIYGELFEAIRQRAKAHLDCEDCKKMKAECALCGATVLDCEACEAKRNKCQKCILENFELEDCSLEIEVVDGYVTKTTVKFDAYMDVGEKGEDVAVCGKIQLHVNNPGESVSVVLPQGSSGWQTYAYGRRPSLRDLIK